MKSLLISIILSIIPFCATAEELDSNNELLFKGITKQSSDYSCGAAALATLITGLVENKHVSEGDVMQTINSLSEHKAHEGYSLVDLMNASKKLGHYAEWRKISTTELIKIKIPVILLIGLNSEFPHFVVLKGIKNGEAFLADSIRGNIRVTYDELIKEGINEKYNRWFVMAIEPSANRPKDSTLYLPENENERLKSHLTVEQSNAITLTTLSKIKQWITDYSFIVSLGNDKQDNVESKTFEHILTTRYGITDDIELGGSIRYSDNTTEMNFNNDEFSFDSSDKQYTVYSNYKYKLDHTNETNLILGLDMSYLGNNVFTGGLNVIGYRNTEFAQIILGASINRTFDHSESLDIPLSKYIYSGFIGANKPLGNRYLASISFAVNDGKNRNDIEEFERSYVASTSFTYVINKKFQISPLLTYSFGNGETLSLGMNIAYIGDW